MINNNSNRTQKVINAYRGSVSVLGLILWAAAALVFPLPQGETWVIIAVISLFLAFTYTFPLEIYNTPIAITHLLFIGTGILYGPGASIWSTLIGIALGMLTRLIFKTFPEKTTRSFPATLSTGLFELSLLTIPFIFSNTIISWQGMPTGLVQLLKIMGTYTLMHAVIISLDLWLKAFAVGLSLRQILTTLLIVELAPLPFQLIYLNASPSLKNATLVFIAGLPALFSLLLHDAAKNRSRLERRIQDLSLLNEISEVISHGTDLNSLLQVIQFEITKLLGVNNFYIALLDPKTHLVWYPIALKEGQPQEWANRPPANRLTDKVILEDLPLLLTGNIEKQLEEMGVDPDPGQLNAWLGVPLQSPDNIRGCLAVFSVSNRTFSKDDLKLLTTLSGQVGIALQNALRQEKTGHRISRQAEQLNILGQISRQLSGTLQAEPLFNLILQSALEFTNSPTGNITIFNTLTNRYEVKAKQGYPEDLGPDTVPLDEYESQTTHPQIITPDSRSGSQMSVPITYANEVIGAIFLESPIADEYTQNELNFVSQLAQQASQAIRNSELYEETQRRLREQATLATIISHLASNKELNVVLNRVVQAFSAILESAYSGIYLWNSEAEVYEFRSIMRRDENQEVTLPRQISLGEWREMQQKQTATGPLRITTDNSAPASLLKLDKRHQVLIFPLDVGSQPVGLVANHITSTDPVEKPETQLLRTIAAHSAIAIQNAVLFSHVSAGRDRLAAVLNSVGDGVLMVDESGRITLSNTRIDELTGASGLSGSPLSSLPARVLNAIGLSAEDAARFTDSAASEEDGESAYTSHAFQSGDRFYERYTAEVWSEHARSLGWIIVIRDVTEDFKINKTRELLTETLVHDLRSPIGAISTTLEILEENLPEGETDAVITQSLDIANRSTQRVLSLIESLLDISHLESGEIELTTQPIDLRALLEETVEEMVPLANEDRVILSCQLPKDLPHVLADQPMIRRVLINLIDNSLKFTPEGGLVTVFTEPDEQEKIHICIADTGPGIPNEYRQEVFARFSQVPGTRGRRRGSGLGLTFCRLALEAHQEKIWIRDSQNDKGVTMVFSLQIADS